MKRRANWSAISWRGRPSTEFGTVQPSYTPGVHLCDLATALPDYAIAALREAIPAFDQQIKGFAMHDAVLTGGRNTHLLADPHHPRRRLPEPQHPRPVSRRRRRGLRRRHLSAAVDGIEVAQAVALAICGDD